MTEVVGPFRKSSHSGAENNCVEVAPTIIGGQAIRDSKHRAGGPILTFAPGGWQAFLVGAKSTAFSRSTPRRP
ncbi:DUF397 domain-containing protein [Streptomyces sp. ME02-8801-2C]|uniref:DUF397 domain-containing protein n=1 Tax=Streptomyces sp. ME02-8801-2C TaxID=3028680 RepID=UPI0029A13F08|nr:DUF397 domain-containing protein [Streptomyces sp. ME02-8801-2C]MDX3456230.1 DUF397 domain-containing protein [Streptomyces sp. ME02-8801-2C]